MTYTEQAIKIAIENSYEPFKSFKMSEATNTFIRSKSLAVHIKGSTAGKNYYEIFFDPLFWQALFGKEYAIIKAQEFIKHIFNGGTIEQFFNTESNMGKEQQT